MFYWNIVPLKVRQFQFINLSFWLLLSYSGIQLSSTFDFDTIEESLQIHSSIDNSVVYDSLGRFEAPLSSFIFHLKTIQGDNSILNEKQSSVDSRKIYLQVLSKTMLIGNRKHSRFKFIFKIIAFDSPYIFFSD